MTPSRTNFAGYERLAAGDSLSSDGFAFQSENPLIADQVGKLGAVTHQHNAHAAMVDPTTAATVTTAATGGSIPSGTSIHVAYTLLDGQGGESLPTSAIVVTTSAGYATPASPPTAVVSYSAGTLLANTLLYAVTVSDGAGGETALGPAVSVVIAPGHANGEVAFSGLTAITNAASGSSSTAGWRMWRSVDGGSSWNLMGTGSHSTDTFTDTGSSGDCTVNPPTSGTTAGTNKLTVTVPATSQPAAATFFSIYADTTGQFLSPCLLGTYPVADYGSAKVYTALTLLAGAPPKVSRCFPGANKIDPTTDLIVTNPAATGKVLTATSSSVASWETPAGGGGGGPFDSALGVNRVEVSTPVVIPSGGTGTMTIPWPTGPTEINRLVVGVIISHPHINNLSAAIHQVSTSTDADLFKAGSFGAGTALGNPSAVGDPEAYAYFSDHFQAFAPTNLPSVVLEDPGAGTIPGPHLGLAGDGITQFFVPTGDITAFIGGDNGDLTVSVTDTGTNAGTIESVVVYLISSEFDILLRTPQPGIEKATSLGFTSNLNLDSTYPGSAVEIDAGSDITLTVIARMYPEGATIRFYQVNTGKGIFVAGTGVTLNSKGGALKTNGQWSRCELHHRTADNWILSGDITT